MEKLSLITILITIFSLIPSSWLLPLYEVHIANGFPANSPPLITHCFSKNDDLGNHTIKANQEFYWKFHTIPGVYVTMYACRFWWGDKNDKAFEVFGREVRHHWGNDTSWNEPRRYFYIVNEEGFWVFKELQDPPYGGDSRKRGGDKLHGWGDD